MCQEAENLWVSVWHVFYFTINKQKQCSCHLNTAYNKKKNMLRSRGVFWTSGVAVWMQHISGVIVNVFRIQISKLWKLGANQAGTQLHTVTRWWCDQRVEPRKQHGGEADRSPHELNNFYFSFLMSIEIKKSTALSCAQPTQPGSSRLPLTLIFPEGSHFYKPSTGEQLVRTGGPNLLNGTPPAT